ncbi:MAG: MerR family transcriptional regulator [Desulfarculus sp.]|jgi:MerR family mercuric resistance operon transcriptional regulator|nr:MAG: MerR family transcriptional regulator [Desulfarculus sp.]
MANLTIGQLAARAGVKVETVRYYERRGLLPAPPRSPGGYRLYPAEEAGRIRFIRRAQSLGFSLREIAELLCLRVDPRSTCQQVKAQTQAKIADIDRKVVALRQMRQALARLAAQCRGRGPTSACPILEALDAEE